MAGSPPKKVDERAETQAAARAVEARASTLASGEQPRVDPVAATHASTPGAGSAVEGHEHVLRSGDVLGGVYEVKRRIGGGAMGSVYLVEHRELGRRFAAKVVAPHHRYDAIAVQRLRQEARTASAVDHENIVDVTDLGRTDDGSLFVIMELLEGEDLRDRLERAVGDHGHLPDDETRAYVRQILHALEAAHHAGITHRDLKPENIFLARKGSRQVVKIVDFGISKMRDPNDETSITQTGQILGTPLYMAPEQGRSTKQVDGRADLYSVACIVFEMVTGRVPFEGETVYDCVVLHATEPPPPPSSLRPGLSPKIEQWILHGLAKKPEDRFEDAAKMLEAWEEAWRDEPAPASDEATGQAHERASERATEQATERATDEATDPVSDSATDDALGVGASGADLAEVAAPATSATDGIEVASHAAAERRGFPWVAIGGAVVALGIGAAILYGQSGTEATAPTPPPVQAPREPEEVIEPRPTVQVTEPTEPVAPVAPEADEPEALIRRIETRPSGAEVVIDGEVRGTTPFDLALPDGSPIEVTLRRAGRRPVTRSIGADDDATVEIALPARSAGTQAPLAPQ